VFSTVLVVYCIHIYLTKGTIGVRRRLERQWKENNRKKSERANEPK